MSRFIEAVLFDFGGVFTDSPFGAVSALEAELGARPGQLSEIMFGPYDRDTDHPWHRLERGEVSLGEARENIIGMARDEGLEFDPLAMLLRMRAGGGARQVLVDRVCGLRGEGYRTCLVTNNVLEFREAWRSVLPLEELFDLVVDSSEVGVRKPNPEIFHLTLEKLGGVAPQRAVFLDDYEGNLQAARSLGIHTVLVGSDCHAAIDELDQLLEG